MMMSAYRALAACCRVIRPFSSAAVMDSRSPACGVPLPRASRMRQSGEALSSSLRDVKDVLPGSAFGSVAVPGWRPVS